jgi:hypothetical protein
MLMGSTAYNLLGVQGAHGFQDTSSVSVSRISDPLAGDYLGVSFDGGETVFLQPTSTGEMSGISAKVPSSLQTTLRSTFIGGVQYLVFSSKSQSHGPRHSISYYRAD